MKKGILILLAIILVAAIGWYLMTNVFKAGPEVDFVQNGETLQTSVTVISPDDMPPPEEPDEEVPPLP
ncbi:MAG: hypothetical protein V3W20_02625 [Candidatus Neomarinimicrobiota bacterium]